MSEENLGSGPSDPPGRIVHLSTLPADPVAGGPTVRGYVAAIRRKLWVVGLFAVLGVGLSLFAVMRSEQLYVSKAVIQLPEQRGSGGGGLAGLAASVMGGGGSLNAQAQVIRSRLLLGMAVDSLQLRLLREVPGFPRSRWRPVGFLDDVQIAPALSEGALELEFTESGYTARFEGAEVRARYRDPVRFPGLSFSVPHPPALEEVTLYVVHRDVAINAMIEEIAIFVRDGTNLLDVVATGYDPVVTQRISDTLAVLYKQFVAARTRQQAERQREFVVAQLEMTEQLLRETQDRLTEFRQREGLYSSRAQAMMDQAGRAEIEVREAEIAAERDVYRTLLRRLQQQGESVRPDVLRAVISSPTVAGNPAMVNSYEQLMRFTTQRDSLTIGRFGRSATNADVIVLDSLISLEQDRLFLLTAGQVESLDARLEAIAMIRRRVDAAFQQLALTEPEEVRLMLQLESIADAAKELRERFYTAGMLEASMVEEVTILDQALPGDRTGAGPIRSLLLGLLFGLLVGGAGAVVLDNTNRSIRRRDEVETVLRVPGLGVIPPLSASTGSRARLKLPVPIWNGNGAGAIRTADLTPELVTATQVHSIGAEAYRTIRTNLAFSRGTRRPWSVMVSSASLGEGKSTTAANLAITFAQQGQRVLLVDADLRRPRIHALFQAQREPGLTEVLHGALDARHAAVETPITGLHVLTAGSAPVISAADLLSGEAVRKLLDGLADRYDLVIIDSPPVLLTADAPILATQVDGVLLVVRAGQTERESAQYALHQLASVGATLLGAVLNDPDATLASQRSYAAAGYPSA